MNLGPNRHLIGKPIDSADLSTPALLVDLDALEANIATMAERARPQGIALRPHGKTHKSPEIARRQIAAGAVGVCCATVREAEAMADAGLDGILVTTPVVTPAMIARLVHARDKVASLAAVVDSEAGVARLAEMARPGQPIDVFVDVDVGLGRTGVPGAEEAVRLARLAADAPALHFRGVQAYYGHLQHIPTFEERRVRVEEQWRHLGNVLTALEAAGLAAEIVSGSGTGTHHIDLAGGPFTELQVGSYIFMDKMYGAVEIEPGGIPFLTSLTVAGRVTSVSRPERPIVDAGTKSLSTDSGPALIAAGAPEGAVYQFMGDEHGAIVMPDGVTGPRLGDLVHFVTPHCDPTINLHDHYHVVRNGRLVDIWPVEGRGH
jgi:D-serine deaminase-like pyridoxal phosphate-dependent protein